jgi:hypothetical protein
MPDTFYPLKIEALFVRKGHALVVVGAAHFVGADGTSTGTGSAIAAR